MTYRSILNRLMGRSAAVPLAARPLAGQVPNDAGGWVYALDDWARLDRFLILGSEAGTYYASAEALTAENAAVVTRCLAADGARTVARIVELSAAGRAPRNDPALFALAMAAAAEDADTRAAALAALSRVARTGTHVLMFAGFIDGLRGWGRGLRRGVARWFAGQPAERLALQAVKYASRDGWALRDLLRLAHPLTDEVDRRALFDWIAHPERESAVAAAAAAFPLVDGVQRLRGVTDPMQAAQLIVRYSLPREAVPTELLNAVPVWDALLVDMPMTAMIRNLGKMTAVGFLTPEAPAAAYVAGRLRDGAALARARVHPAQILLALRTYARGRGERGGLSWAPVPAIVEALNDAFDLACAAVAPTGQRLLVAVDVSGSMRAACAGSPTLSALEAGAAMLLPILRVEPRVEVIAFHTAVEQPGLTAGQRLDDVLLRLQQYDGGTDLAQPVLYALDRGLVVDAFVVVTDNETWAGREHAKAALDRYRSSVNAAARIAVLATTASRGQVVPADDPLALGIAGFDAAVPRLVEDFVRA